MIALFVNEQCGYFGGVEQNIAHTAAGLRARGHRCYLAYGRETGRGVESYRAHFDGAFPCRELVEAAQSPPAFGELLERLRPDAVYLHKVNDLAFCKPMLGRVRIVRMVHDHDLCCPRRHKYLRGSGRVCSHPAGWRCFADLAFVARDANAPLGILTVSIGKKIRAMRENYALDALLVGSRFMQSELLQNGFPSDKVHILPPVVTCSDMPNTRVPEENRVLFAGQLIRGKGVDLLLRALQRVKVDFKAAIVGTGNAQNKLEALSKDLALSERVRFYGWVDPEDLSAFYTWSKVVVVPSRWPEPFGMVGLEAMHRGRPVIGFEVGGIPDWIESGVTGLLVPEQNVALLGDAITRLLTSTRIARMMGANAYRRVHERFGFEVYLDQLEAHLFAQKRRVSALAR